MKQITLEALAKPREASATRKRGPYKSQSDANCRAAACGVPRGFVRGALLMFMSSLLPLYAAEPLREGDAVPDVAVRTAEGEDVRLRDLTASQPTVLIFYRGGWCPYCTRHLAALAGIEEALEQLGYRVWAISPDRPQKIAEAMKEAVFNYQLLSDSSMAAAQEFGLAFEVDETTREQYKGYGIDLVDASGETHHLLPVPAVYLVDTEHRIRYAYVNPDYRERLDPDALLNEARKLVP